MIVSFLTDRYVTLEENGIKTERQTYGGCPQGSCLGPLLWLLIADTVLNLNQGKDVRKQAFADDFILKLRALTEQELIDLANDIIIKFQQWAAENDLTINWGKTELLYLNRKKTHNLPRPDSHKLQGIKFSDMELQPQDKIKYLGLIIHKNLSWETHCDNQIKKIQKSFRSLGLMTTKSWGLDADKIKIWYRTVVEKTLLYAAPIWGHSITKNCINKLLSCQRTFALAIVKAYKTAPTLARLLFSDSSSPPTKIRSYVRQHHETKKNSKHIWKNI